MPAVDIPTFAQNSSTVDLAFEAMVDERSGFAVLSTPVWLNEWWNSAGRNKNPHSFLGCLPPNLVSYPGKVHHPSNAHQTLL